MTQSPKEMAEARGKWLIMKSGFQVNGKKSLVSLAITIDETTDLTHDEGAAFVIVVSQADADQREAELKNKIAIMESRACSTNGYIAGAKSQQAEIKRLRDFVEYVSSVSQYLNSMPYIKPDEERALWELEEKCKALQQNGDE